MRQIIVSRSLLRWVLVAAGLAVMGLFAANIYFAVEQIDRNRAAIERIVRIEEREKVERIARAEEIARATKLTCQSQNDLRATLRGTLARAAAVRRAEGDLSPAAARFYAGEIAALADIECDVIVPPSRESP